MTSVNPAFPTLYQKTVDNTVTNINNGKIDLKNLEPRLPYQIYSDILNRIVAQDRQKYRNQVYPFLKAELMLKTSVQNWVDEDMRLVRFSDHVDRELTRDIWIEVKNTDSDEYEEDNGHLVIREYESSDWEYYFHFLKDEYLSENFSYSEDEDNTF
jgi:hypothetical protein